MTKSEIRAEVRNRINETLAEEFDEKELTPHATVEVRRRIAETLREKFDDGELTPHDGPVAQSSKLLYVYECEMEREIEILERRGGQI